MQILGIALRHDSSKSAIIENDTVDNGIVEKLMLVLK